MFPDPNAPPPNRGSMIVIDPDCSDGGDAQKDSMDDRNPGESHRQEVIADVKSQLTETIESISARVEIGMNTAWEDYVRTHTLFVYSQTKLHNSGAPSPARTRSSAQ